MSRAQLAKTVHRLVKYNSVIVMKAGEDLLVISVHLDTTHQVLEYNEKFLITFHLNISFSSSDCVECECDEFGSIGQSCDLVTGKCKCKSNFIGDKCSECAPNLFNCK
jgi:hypothetical protein